MRLFAVGYRELGGILGLQAAAARLGFDSTVVLANRPQSVVLDPQLPVRLVKADVLDSLDLMRALIKERFDPSTDAFVCQQDRPMFAYMEAFGSLKSKRLFLNQEYLQNARNKFAARSVWDDGTHVWLVRRRQENIGRSHAFSPLCDDFDVRKLQRKNSEVHSDHSRNVGADLRSQLEDGVYIKPVAGMGSEYVFPATDELGLLDRIEEISRSASSSDLARYRKLGAASYDIDLASDIIVESAHKGAEMTCDGYLIGEHIHAVVQHKETRVATPFQGDGIIISPPDPKGRSEPFDNSHYKTTAALRSSEADVIRFVRNGLLLLGARDCVFHVELVETEKGLRFIEVNPRTPGGLLARTAQLRLGASLIDANLSFHLRRKVSKSAADSVVTAQFPVYAFKRGAYKTPSDEALKKVERRYPTLDKIQPAFAGKKVVDDSKKENYLCYVALKGKSHAEVRRSAREIWNDLTNLYANQG